MKLKEVVLLYNINDPKRKNHYKTFFENCRVELKQVTEKESAVPLGFLAYGTDEQKAEYMSGDSELTGFPEEPMMVIAGFTNQRLTLMLSALRENGLTEASLKAVLTEHNAVWDSATLYKELVKERAAFEK